MGGGLPAGTMTTAVCTICLYVTIWRTAFPSRIAGRYLSRGTSALTASAKSRFVERTTRDVSVEQRATFRSRAGRSARRRTRLRRRSSAETARRGTPDAAESAATLGDRPRIRDRPVRPPGRASPVRAAGSCSGVRRCRPDRRPRRRPPARWRRRMRRRCQASRVVSSSDLLNQRTKISGNGSVHPPVDVHRRTGDVIGTRPVHDLAGLAAAQGSRGPGSRGPGGRGRL